MAWVRKIHDLVPAFLRILAESAAPAGAGVVDQYVHMVFPLGQIGDQFFDVCDRADVAG
jgi:hypothetical protein